MGKKGGLFTHLGQIGVEARSLGVFKSYSHSYSHCFELFTCYSQAGKP